MSECNKPHLLAWDSILTDFVLDGQESLGETLVNHILDMPVETLQDQVKLLGSVSNYHWWASLDIYGKQKSASNQPKYQQHLLFFPGQRKALPSSPRNLLMYLAPHMRTPQMLEPRFCTPHQRQIVQNIMQLVKYDQEIEVTILHKKQSQQQATSPPSPTTDNEMGPPLKRRRYAYREISAAPGDILEGTCRDGLQAVESSVPQRTLFTSFSEELHSRGIVQWRMHLEDLDTVILNDYSATSGQLRPLDYVHVTAYKTDSDQVQIKCTCRIYQYMHSQALRKSHMEDGHETVLALSFTCMHCRFYSTYLQQFSSLFNSQDCLNKLHEKVRQTEVEVNAPVVLLGESGTNITTKLSVAGPDSVALLHIHFSPSGCFATCQDGVCQTLYKVKRRVPVGISLRELERGQMCDHIYTLFHNQDFLDALFPDFFNPADPPLEPPVEVDDTDPADGPAPEVINQDDMGVRTKISENIAFNVSEGRWECSSHSHFKPRLDRFDPDLVRATQARLEHCRPPLTNRGHYKGPQLSPDMTPPEGQAEKLCPAPGCGSPFTDHVERHVTVYTREVCLSCSNSLYLLM